MHVEGMYTEERSCGHDDEISMILVLILIPNLQDYDHDTPIMRVING